MSTKRKRTIAGLTALSVAIAGLGVGSALAQSGKSTTKTGTTGNAKAGTAAKARTSTTKATTTSRATSTGTSATKTPRASSARAVTSRPRLTG